MDVNGIAPDLIVFIRQQKDRQEIQDCMLRYTRGIDRQDRELFLSAYHSDAVDQHGVTEGDPQSFYDWAASQHRAIHRTYQHFITNHSVELDGDTAHGESYCLFWSENREGPPTLGFGRYIDRYEKRDGVWAIAHRVCIHEKFTTLGDLDIPEELLRKMKSTGPNKQDRTDLSYARPLAHNQSRLTVASA